MNKESYASAGGGAHSVNTGKTGMHGGAVAPTLQAPCSLQSWPECVAPPSPTAIFIGWSCIRMSPVLWH
ncbi:hypothetical protein BA896_016000 [Janthinobacterium lividum]|uniref:Uncharacterized protein n=1 Tax=Janthinobacterium lividum TaxID=29581 RepID=A0A1E8PN69_9BURK|nr:hypothetical protein BA896_016000 [Janthinobacterium lividum]